MACLGVSGSSRLLVSSRGGRAEGGAVGQPRGFGLFGGSCRAMQSLSIQEVRSCKGGVG